MFAPLKNDPPKFTKSNFKSLLKISQRELLTTVSVEESKRKFDVQVRAVKCNGKIKVTYRWKKTNFGDMSLSTSQKVSLVSLVNLKLNEKKEITNEGEVGLFENSISQGTQGVVEIKRDFRLILSPKYANKKVSLECFISEPKKTHDVSIKIYGKSYTAKVKAFQKTNGECHHVMIINLLKVVIGNKNIEETKKLILAQVNNAIGLVERDPKVRIKIGTSGKTGEKKKRSVLSIIGSMFKLYLAYRLLKYAYQKISPLFFRRSH